MAQRKITVVSAACAVVKIGGSERYLYKGSVVPSGADQKDVKRLVEIGLLKQATVTDDESAAESTGAQSGAGGQGGSSGADQGDGQSDTGKGK